MRCNEPYENQSVIEISYNLQLQKEIDYKTLGQHLRIIRKSLGLTQAKMAELMNLNTNYYGEYETGKRRINLPRFIQFICLTQCSADKLLRGCHKDYPSKNQQSSDLSAKRKELNSLIDKCDDDLIGDLILIVELLRKRR